MDTLAAGLKMLLDERVQFTTAIVALSCILNLEFATSDLTSWPGPNVRISRWRTESWSAPIILEPRLDSESCSCIEAKLCPEFLEMLEHRSTRSEELRQLTCGFRGFIPFVCCNLVSVRRSLETSYFPTPTIYPSGYNRNCDQPQPMTTVQPRINPGPTPYHNPGVYYNTADFVQPTTPTYRLSSPFVLSSKADDEMGYPNNRFLQNTPFRPRSNDHVTESTFLYNAHNANSNPNFHSHMPVTPSIFPDYVVKPETISPPGYYNTENSHGFSNPNSFHHFNQPGSKPDFPNRPVSSANWNGGHQSSNFPTGSSVNDPYHNSNPNVGTHTQYNPPDKDQGHFNYNHNTNYPFHNMHNDFGNLDIHSQFQPDNNQPKHPPNDTDSYENNYDSHSKPVETDRDEFGFQNHPHYHQHNHAIAAGHHTPSPELPTGDTEMRNVTDNANSTDEPVKSPEKTSTTIPELGVRERKRILLPSDECGIPQGERIVGGKNALLGQYPWIARIGYTPYVSPICLPFDSLRNKTYTGLVSLVAGWGATDIGTTGSNQILQWVEVKVIPSVTCAKAYAERTGTMLGPGQICAGGARGQDSCEGDSGGPLMRGELQRYYLLGLVSFGAKRCGSENLPGVYTEIPTYLDWILDNIEP
ncbi:uncharacterized protein [Periplaneta americana]|uniref:uncharacterized protein isoform X3 n=1 Tax=Periplaneta americana TaxID=6978 RepID=UPI0037E856D3